jgi:hypothetical protein
MRSKCRESESCYNAGCRSEACRLAATEGRRDRRRRGREAVGELDNVDMVGQPVVSITDYRASTSDYLSATVEAAVREEISAYGDVSRPGLAAAAMALAAVLDNPRATSSKPPAAGALVNILNLLRKSAAAAKQTPLASVRRMTRPDKG